ncbi:glycosyltransferase family 2 protein [uncultured Bifidobacterium sp.]|uniref:glycosyltransferase family 2 protein n=1 Tax=uncultured Bifidobacterium sp. TaxID=165187 RepID=UPI0028DB5D14|nr:glycosyltransferase family 2 protein [uncultured Bifidobacterium sp.]
MVTVPWANPARGSQRGGGDALVSVIVPVYDAEDHLSYCLDSLTGQSHRRLEIILVDDGSTDSSGRICDSYAASDDRISVIHRANGGIGSAQNAGLDASHGDFIAFCDNDDILDRRNIELLLHALTSTGASMSKARWRQFGLSRRADIARLAAEGAEPPRGVTVFADPLRAYQTVFCKSLRMVGQRMGRHTEARYLNEANWCRLYRREVWEGIRFPEHAYAQDVMVAGRLYERMDAVADVDLVLYHWLQSPASVTHAERSFGFYHDNVMAGIANFRLALRHGITPMRSYYTMVGALGEEARAAAADNMRVLSSDRSDIHDLIAGLRSRQRFSCSMHRWIRLAEKVVYDKRIKTLR